MHVCPRRALPGVGPRVISVEEKGVGMLEVERDRRRCGLYREVILRVYPDVPNVAVTFDGNVQVPTIRPERRNLIRDIRYPPSAVGYPPRYLKLGIEVHLPASSPCATIKASARQSDGTTPIVATLLGRRHVTSAPCGNDAQHLPLVVAREHKTRYQAERRRNDCG